jgi:FtsP/CotA-like multicopper oxidase with cupredoxin domain
MKKLLTIAFLAVSLFTAAQGQLKEVFLQSKMDGEKELPDGTEIQYWGYGLENLVTGLAKISLPSPTLRFDLGDTVRIQLRNTSPEAHTIHWHGLDVDQQNDGVGHTSGNVIPNDLFVYEFVCTHSGTYIYHCHVLTPLHLAMGMYGLFIVNGEEEMMLYDETTQFTKEFSFLFSEMNLNWNVNPLSPGLFALYTADYLMINGKSDLEVDFEENNVVGTTDDTLAFRMANIGYGSIEVKFPEELDVYIVGADGRKIPPVQLADLVLYPGERYDLIAVPLAPFDGVITAEYFDLRNYNLLGTNLIPVTITSTVGLVENSLSRLIYPNPFTMGLFVEPTSYPSLIEVIDFTGKQVFTTSIDGPAQLNLQHLEKGMYVVYIDGVPFKAIKQ